MPDTDSGLLVIDVDNTIYDWIGIWARAFEAMTRVLERDTGRDAAYWRAALRTVHLRRHAVECPSALEELAGDGRGAPFNGSDAIFARAAAAYRRGWDTHLAPYDGVRASLVRLVEQGWRVVAYTESDAAVTASRLMRMGLAGVIPRVFGRAPFSSPARREWALVDVPTRLPIGVDHVPRADMKPNPAGLHDIVHRCGAAASRTVYIGDNLFKDVAMAQRVGVRALWAQYGTVRLAEHTALLESVAHWSPADVAQERATGSCTVLPDATLREASELFDAVAAMPVAMGG